MKYEGGLRAEILAFVAPLEIRNYVALVNKCRVVKDYTKRLTLERFEAYMRKQRHKECSPNSCHKRSPSMVEVLRGSSPRSLL